jgi:hypothetical protein
MRQANFFEKLELPSTLFQLALSFLPRWLKGHPAGPNSASSFFLLVWKESHPSTRPCMVFRRYGAQKSSC